MLGGLRLARSRADLVHCVGPLPVVPNRVDLDTVTFCQAAYDEATGGRIKGSASSFGWRAGQRFTVALERWWFRRRVRVLVGISEGSGADLQAALSRDERRGRPARHRHRPLLA